MKNKSWYGWLAYTSGRNAEKIACHFLEKKGYRLIAQNKRCQRGIGANEIDLIMKKNKTLIFVEVKKRHSSNQCAYAITPKAQQRIFRAAEIFIAQNPNFQDYQYRFDALLISDSERPTHILDAWRG